MKNVKFLRWASCEWASATNGRRWTNWFDVWTLVLERSVKKLQYKVDVIRLGHIEEHHGRPTCARRLQQGFLTLSCCVPSLFWYRGLLFSAISRQALGPSNLFSSGHCGLFSCRMLNTYLNPVPRLSVSGITKIPVFGIWHHVDWNLNLHIFTGPAKLGYKQCWLFFEHMLVLPMQFLHYIFIPSNCRLLQLTGNGGKKWFSVTVFYFLSFCHRLHMVCTVVQPLPATTLDHC